jgi:hypothetical protein
MPPYTHNPRVVRFLAVFAAALVTEARRQPSEPNPTPSRDTTDLALVPRKVLTSCVAPADQLRARAVASIDLLLLHRHERHARPPQCGLRFFVPVDAIELHREGAGGAVRRILLDITVGPCRL